MQYYVGGGVTLRTGPRWGIRPEIRLCRIEDGTYYRMSAAVFYSLR